MSPLPSLLAAAWACAAAPLHAQAVCEARGGPTVPAVVELFTSEGCSSCPPADRWLTQRRSTPGVIALAFHVDYWDRLGWPDRYASPAYAERQRLWQRRLGLRFVYTPQVVLDGEDRKDWPRIDALRPTRAAAAEASLRRIGADTYEAEIRARPGAPALAAYWAVTEDGHRTVVEAGENDGVTLHHDAVVRHYEELPAVAARTGSPARYTLQLPAGDGRARRIVLVVHEAASGRPVQAVSLGC